MHRTLSIINLTKKEFIIYYTYFKPKTIIKYLKITCNWSDDDVIISTNAYKSWNFKKLHVVTNFSIVSNFENFTVAVSEYGSTGYNNNDDDVIKAFTEYSIKKMYVVCKHNKCVIDEVDITQLKNVRNSYLIDSKFDKK